MTGIINSDSSIAQGGFKTGFEIAQEKGLNIEQEVRAVKAFKNIESIFKDDKAGNTISITQEKLKENVQAVKPIQANKPELKKTGIFKVSTGSTTTPPKINQEKPKVKIYRLSDFSIKILEIIRDCGAVTNRDFCAKLNKRNTYVMQYLYRLQNYGFIYRNNDNWKWYLCDLDNDFFVDLDNILYNIYNINTTLTQQQHNVNTIYKVKNVLTLNNNPEIKIEKKKTNTETQKSPKTKQSNIVELLQKAQQDQIERGVVELLASEVETEIIMNLASWCDKTQTEATQRAYRHYENVYKFADEIGYSLADVQAALCSLDDKGWVYTVPPNKDKYGKWKIGFTEDFLEKVRNR